MDDKLKQAFDGIHAEPPLKKRTVEYVLSKGRNRRKTYAKRLAAAVLVLAAVSSGGAGLFFSQTGVISIDVNPSVELGVNRFDRVISVEGMNDDGIKLAEKLDVKFKGYADAVEKVLESLRLSDDDIVEITVAGPDDSKNDAMLETVKSCASGYGQPHCYSAFITDAEQAQAHEAGLSCGKYRAYLELHGLDPSVTTDDVQDMTMREIQNQIDSHHAEDHVSGHSVTDSGNCSNSGGSYNNGNGTGSGNVSGSGTTAATGSCNGNGHGHGAKHGH